MFGDVLLEDRRRKRPKAFAELRLEVHLLLHLRVAWVPENAAPAERSRSELHPSLEPTDDLSLRQLRRDIAGQLAEVVVAASDGVVTLHRPLDFPRRELRAQKRPPHRVTTVALGALATFADVPDGECCAKCSAGIAG